MESMSVESMSMESTSMELEQSGILQETDEFAIETIHLSKFFGKEKMVNKVLAKPPVRKIARDLGIPEEYLVPYGRNKAKVDLRFLRSLEDRPQGKLILVTATTPTAAE